jgi:hypothetical protein
MENALQQVAANHFLSPLQLHPLANWPPSIMSEK